MWQGTFQSGPGWPGRSRLPGCPALTGWETLCVCSSLCCSLLWTANSAEMLTWHGERREDLHAGSTNRRNGPVSCLECCVVLRMVAIWQVEEAVSDRSSGSTMGTPSAKSCHRPTVFWFVSNMETGELSHAQCGLQGVLRKSLLEDQGETGFLSFSS